MSILYIPHGAGPMPLLGEPQHKNLVSFLTEFAESNPRPDAVVVISAHWETENLKVNYSKNHSILYDYYGFPPQAYQIQYPAQGDLKLGSDVLKLLEDKGIVATTEKERGLDHGVFVPLKIMYPDADIPVIQISLLNSLDPEKHIKIGKALSKLVAQNILILGSGSSFHNMSLVQGVSPSDQQKSEEFDRWLIDVCTSDKLSCTERNTQLIEWKSAPSASFSHPREEHLLPLHVCFGAAQGNDVKAKVIFNELFMGVKVSAIHWS